MVGFEQRGVPVTNEFGYHTIEVVNSAVKATGQEKLVEGVAIEMDFCVSLGEREFQTISIGAIDNSGEGFIGAGVGRDTFVGPTFVDYQMNCPELTSELDGLLVCRRKWKSRD